MMKGFRNILWLFGVTIGLLFTSCNVVEEPMPIDGSYNLSPYISGACKMTDISIPELATRSLIDQVTTQSMAANFLRIDEDVIGGSGTDKNDGTYTFTGYSMDNASHTTVPYTTVNWERGYMLEAQVISSPDNTPGIYYRSISFNPVQSYKIIAETNPVSLEEDTTHFYHTRMVGWYPQTNELPINDQGKAVVTLFDDYRFNDVRNDEVVVSGRKRVGVQFSDLDGSKDVMVSNVKEAQHWHHYDVGNLHNSDIHPNDDSDIYRTPFGHYTTGPHYSNYFTYKHYLSAVRIWAYAEQSQQNLTMWGSLNNVVFQKQPHTCKIWLPEELNDEWGEVYEWSDERNTTIIKTPLYGDDTNHSDEEYTAHYPISMSGAGSAENKVYLGYALIRPNYPITLELHTTNGVYVVDVAKTYTKLDDSEVDIFQPGFVYDIMLNLQTSGTIAVLLENESNEHFYDLTTLQEFVVGSGTVSSYKYANCYIVSPNDDSQKRVDPSSGNLVPYDGFCFSATTVGNGQGGILSYGSQKMYPEDELIAPTNAKIIWESSLGLISDIELLYGYVRFRVPNSDLEGNAVIGVYDDSDNILWSWHIWITDKPGEQSFSTGGSTYTFLDRNIGATASRWTGSGDALETYGLYYQWGRKDPSIGPPSFNYSQINLVCAPYYDYSSARHTSVEVKQFATPSLRDGIENPMYFVLPMSKTNYYEFNWIYNNNNILWGYSGESMSKTIYDPCPFGYRVPAAELSTLFNNSTRTNDDFGQIHSVSGTQFYFPYTGYKGVDRGLNSIVGEWKYVGQKGDYQSAIYNEETGGQHMHRSRVYISKLQSWTEPGTGEYNAYVTQDYTNRRTAAPIRCVKNEDYGIVTSTLDLGVNTITYGGTIPVLTTAKALESVIISAKLEVIYRTSGGSEVREVLFNESGYNSNVWNNTYNYLAPDASFFATVEGGLTFVFTVITNLGVSSSATKAIDFSSVTVSGPTFESLLNGAGGPVVGQPINLIVNVSSNVTISSVTIDGQTATARSGGNYVVEKSFATSANETLPVVVNLSTGSYTTNITIPVYNIELGSALTSVNFDTDGYYVFSNTAFTSTYLTNADNTNLTASTTLDYASLFGFDSSRSPSIIRNIKSNSAVGRSGSNISINVTNSYTIAYNSGRFSILYSNRYWKQTNETVVTPARYTNGNYWWYIYPVNFVAPE